MQRYFLYLSYDGYAYHGWQIQPNGISVQEVLQNKLSLLLRSEIEIVGAGRTDAGVHARLMVAHFDSPSILEPEQLTERLNRMLPQDIAIQQCVPVRPDAHSRFDATSRKYKYYLVGAKSPFSRHYAYRCHGEIDFEKMNEAAKILFEYSDFTSFSKLHTDVKTNLCRIYHAQWEKEGEHWVFTISADRFLRNMVRAIVGTLLEVGRGKLSIDGFRQVIEDKDRCKAGNSVPGNALFLVDITYPDTIFNLE